MNEITIRVVGIPAPQGSKTLTRYGAMIEASKKVKPWRTDVKEAALNCYSSGALNLPVKAISKSSSKPSSPNLYLIL